MNATSATATTPLFSPDRYVVPVGFVGPNYAVGSGFIGKRGDRVAFYTAAHNVADGTINGRTWPIDDWKWLIPELPVYTSAASSPACLAIQIYTSDSGKKEPLFNWREPVPGSVRDALKFDTSQIHPLLEACLDEFDVVDLDVAAADPNPSDEVTCVGFPWPEGDGPASWPYFPPARESGPFLRVECEHILADFVGKKGFSGGPAFTGDGLFVGMVVGAEKGIRSGRYYNYARIVTAQDLFSL